MSDFFFLNNPATTEIYTLSLHDPLPICVRVSGVPGSLAEQAFARAWARLVAGEDVAAVAESETAAAVARARLAGIDAGDRKSTRLNSSHANNSYAGFCLKKKIRTSRSEE